MSYIFRWYRRENFDGSVIFSLARLVKSYRKNYTVLHCRYFGIFYILRRHFCPFLKKDLPKIVDLNSDSLFAVRLGCTSCLPVSVAASLPHLIASALLLFDLPLVCLGSALSVQPGGICGAALRLAGRPQLPLQSLPGLLRRLQLRAAAATPTPDSGQTAGMWRQDNQLHKTNSSVPSSRDNHTYKLAYIPDKLPASFWNLMTGTLKR